MGKRRYSKFNTYSIGEEQEDADAYSLFLSLRGRKGYYRGGREHTAK